MEEAFAVALSLLFSVFFFCVLSPRCCCLAIRMSSAGIARCVTMQKVLLVASGLLSSSLARWSSPCCVAALITSWPKSSGIVSKVEKRGFLSCWKMPSAFGVTFPPCWSFVYLRCSSTIISFQCKQKAAISRRSPHPPCFSLIVFCCDKALRRREAVCRPGQRRSGAISTRGQDSQAAAASRAAGTNFEESIRRLSYGRPVEQADHGRSRREVIV